MTPTVTGITQTVLYFMFLQVTAIPIVQTSVSCLPFGKKNCFGLAEMKTFSLPNKIPNNSF